MRLMMCCLCRQKHVSLKKLQTHYLTAHSKAKITKYLLKLKILLATPKVFTKRRRLTEKLKNNISLGTLNLSEELTILMKRNEIVLKDCKQNLQFKFPMNTDLKNGKIPEKPKRISFRRSDVFQIVRLDISPLQNNQSLDEKFGDFYICKCRKHRSVARKNNLTILTSDKESCCSEAENLKCKVCGNMYRTQELLIEHLYLHIHLSDALLAETDPVFVTVYACHICNMNFDCDHLLHRHFEWHQEMDMLEMYMST